MSKEEQQAAGEIGLRIARRRIELGMSQKDLSVQADVPYQTISSIENGKRLLKTKTLLKIAAALSVPLSVIQPKALDQYGESSSDLFLLCERLKRLPPAQRKLMITMFSAQIDVLPSDYTPT